MKRILYIAVILMGILPFFGKELQSSCSAQSMASESLWDKADETGEYHSVNCNFCSDFIGGTSKEDAKKNMDSHVYSKHYDRILSGEYQVAVEDDGDGSNEGNDNGNNDNNNDNNSGNNDNSGYNYTKVIDIEYAASIAQQIGLDYASYFLYNYSCYGDGYLFGKVAYLSSFIRFIQNKYGARLSANVPVYSSKYFIITSDFISGNCQFYKIETIYGNTNSPYGIYIF